MDPAPLGRKDVERLYTERGRELWARIYACCLDADLALEALHEALLRLATNGHNGAIKNPAAWVVRTAQNWLRDQKRRTRVENREAAAPGDAERVTGDDPPTSMARRETMLAVRTALEELAPEDREVLVLRYYLGWPSQRIAEVLETTPAAVDMRLSRARKRLGERLSQRGITDEPAW